MFFIGRILEGATYVIKPKGDTLYFCLFPRWEVDY